MMEITEFPRIAMSRLKVIRSGHPSQEQRRREFFLGRAGQVQGR